MPEKEVLIAMQIFARRRNCRKKEKTNAAFRESLQFDSISLFNDVDRCHLTIVHPIQFLAIATATAQRTAAGSSVSSGKDPSCSFQEIIYPLLCIKGERERIKGL